MTTVILACGPYFQRDGAITSLLVLLVFKPIAYFAFIHAFRYRVSYSVPMTSRQAASLAALRALIGFAFVVAGALALSMMNATGAVINTKLIIVSWAYLYLERLLVWSWLGSSKAGLRGRRLFAWTAFGTLLNAAFDYAVIIGLFTGFIAPSFVLVAIAFFIWIVHVLGRRASLQNRFSNDPLCMKCQYNLTGNLSGICPECGTPVAESIAAKTVIAN